MQYVTEVATAIRMMRVVHTAEVGHPEVVEDMPGTWIVLGRNGKFSLELPSQAHSGTQLLSPYPHAEAAAEIIDQAIRANFAALTTQMQQSTQHGTAQKR